MRTIELSKKGVFSPLKAEYDRVNHTLSGLRATKHARAREEGLLSGFGDDVTAGDPACTTGSEIGGRWISFGKGDWVRIHTTERRQLFVPTAEAAEHGPNLEELGPHRITQVLYSDGTRQSYEDDWKSSTARLVLPKEWTGMTLFTHASPIRGAGDQLPSFEPRHSIAPDD